VCRIWGEDSDSIARLQRVDGSFVRLGILGVICGVRVKRAVEVVVDLGDVLVEMLAYEL
jgi:hypothetical protein